MVGGMGRIRKREIKRVAEREGEGRGARYGAWVSMEKGNGMGTTSPRVGCPRGWRGDDIKRNLGEKTLYILELGEFPLG